MPTIPTKYVILVVSCAAALLFAWVAVSKYHSRIDDAYDRGRVAGVTEASQKIAEAQIEEREFRDKEKETIENAAKDKIDEANRAADAALERYHGVQLQLGQVRDTVRKYSDTDTSGTAAIQTVDLLTDLLERHISTNRELAAFADAAHIAGATCEQQYDSLRLKYKESKN